MGMLTQNAGYRKNKQLKKISSGSHFDQHTDLLGTFVFYE